MDKKSYMQILASGVRDYDNRPLLTEATLKNPTWVLILLENISDIENKDSHFSARILELTCKNKLSIVLPYLDHFVKILSSLELDGSIRASAKIIELLCVEYFIKYTPQYIEKLNVEYLELFTENCFDWMISDKAIAIQAHSMYSLYLLGEKFEWIHTELIENIEKNLPTGSTGYQNRGRKIIKAITTNKLFKL